MLKRLLLDFWYFLKNEIPPKTPCDWCGRESPIYYGDYCPFEHGDLEPDEEE